MSDQNQTPRPPVPPAGRFHGILSALANAYRKLHPFDRRKPKRNTALIYALIIAIGVPLISICISSMYTKLVIACVWFAVVPFYMWSEGVELESQVRRFGLLDQQESDHQRKTMYYLYFAVIFAFVLWLLVLAIYIAGTMPHTGVWNDVVYALAATRTTPLRYGLVEWGILVHTLLVGYLAIDVYYPLISNFLQATAGQRRVEQETLTVEPRR